MAKKSIAKVMEKAEVDSKNQDLNEILRSTEAQTEAELKEAGQRSAYVEEYMTLNKELSGKINEFLDENQKFTEKFKAVLQDRDTSSLKRLGRTIPGFGKLIKENLDPGSVAELLNDMYTNMILQKDAVAKQVGILEERADGLFEQSAATVENYRAAAAKFQTTKAQYSSLEGALAVAQELSDENGMVGDIDVAPLVQYFQFLEGQRNEGTEIEEMALEKYFTTTEVDATTMVDLLDLTTLVDELERAESDLDEQRVKWEIELNAANSALKGYRVQKKQFAQYLETTRVMLFGLDTHLRYSKELVENQAILAQSAAVATKAMESFVAYQDAINQTFILNSVGVQAMARQTAEAFSRDMYDEASLEEATDRVAEAKEYWRGFRDRYTDKATELAEKIERAQQEGE